MGVLGAIGTSMKLSVARNPRWMDTVTSAQRIDVSPWELFMMNCLIPGLIPFLIDGSMVQQRTILRGWLGNSDCWTKEFHDITFCSGKLQMNGRGLWMRVVHWIEHSWPNYVGWSRASRKMNQQLEEGFGRRIGRFFMSI